VEPFRSSRAGARNVAGVAYQSYLTAALLLGGINGEWITNAVPEGDEDIDLTLGTPSRRLYIQAKFRSNGLAKFELAQALTKAWSAVQYSASREIPRIAVQYVRLRRT
jgi:hypothetical protein